MVKRWYERHMPDPGCGSDEGSEGEEDKSAAAISGTERVGRSERV